MMSNQNPADENEENSHEEPMKESSVPTTRRSVLKGAGAVGISGAFLANASGTSEAHEVNDHLAKTPPMGWSSWNTFRCNISADLIKETADAMVESGMKDVGYEYVNIDDCWMAHQRNESGELEANPDRFPNGMKNTGDYLHNKGLKFGIYESAGTTTCAAEYDDYPSPGSLNHEQTDAQTFAEWGVDYLKYDNCGDHLGIPPQTRFQRMWDALEATDRDIVKSQTTWGIYESWETWAKDIGSNLWRTTYDITDSWPRIMDILDQQVGLAKYAEPGHWNDPDMLEVGNEGLTETESRSQFSMWAILAAPLIAGNDLRNMSETTRKILTNEEVIAVDQDPAGQQGRKIRDDGDQEVWFKPLANGDAAVALLNRAEHSEEISVEPKEMDLPSNRPYRARDLWNHSSEVLKGVLSQKVPSHGTAMYRVSWPPHEEDEEEEDEEEEDEEEEDEEED